MRIRTVSDLVATIIVWFPVLAVLVAVGWVLCVGATNLEAQTNGSQVFVSNQEVQTPDRWKQAGQEQADLGLAGVG